MATNRRTSIDSDQQYEPLDSLEIEAFSKNGVRTRVSAIHIGFMETRYYVLFKMLPASKNDCDKDDSLTAEEEEWLEYMIFLEEDLHWLLKLPHQRFWSQVVFDENLHRCLESYLSLAPRDYDLDNLNIKEELLVALKKVHKLVFLAYLRMSTYKESKEHHIRPSAFGDIVYDNFIFDIPKIMDLCALYGIQNSSILNGMVQNIFSTQPKYKNDLNEASKVILTAFNSVEEKLQNISANHPVENAGNNGRLLPYSDIVNYIADTSITIHTFLESYPPACEMFHQNGFILRIPTFYEQVFPMLEKVVARTREGDNKKMLEEIKRKIILSKSALIKIFRNILNYTCLQNILISKMSNEDEKMCAYTLVENFLEAIIDLISNKSFLCEYNILNPFERDLELFNELEINVDSEKVNYIFCSIHENGELPPEMFTPTVCNGARPKVSSHKPAQNIQDLVDILKPKEPCAAGNYEDPLEEYGAAAPRPTEIEIDSLIQAVLDILPGYGDGFIEKCLDYYGYNTDEVVNALLTDSLPDNLKSLDQNLKREPKNIVQNSYPVLAERKNIYDNDEFDVYSRNDVNLQNMHMGKKNKTPTTYESLQNDKESDLIKTLILTREYEDTDDFIPRDDLYEDEYDDTYDSAMVGLKEPLLEDAPDDDDDSDEDERKPDNENGRRNLNFCINPEILREKAEQRRQARGGFRKNDRGSDRGGSKPADQSHSRQQKDRNKAHVGNHNRRKQADFKRSRGMMPS